MLVWEQAQRGRTDAVLGISPAIIVATTGKLVGMLDEGRVSFDEVAYFVLNDLTGLTLYDDDYYTRKIIALLCPQHHVIALVTAMSERLASRFRELTPQFRRSLKDMMILNDRTGRVQRVLRIVQWIEHKGTVQQQWTAAAKALLVPTENDRQILGLCNFKANIRAI